MKPALELEEAQSRLLALAPSLESETIPVEAALGRFLAKNVAARRTDPAADLSAMDGYAICADGPWTLIGESRAGAPFSGYVGDSKAVRISTGAHVPQGADRILIQEIASVDGDVISLTSDMPVAGKHIRKRGFNFAQGDVVLAKGSQITAPHIALALSAGHATLDISRPPKIAIIDNGDELALDPENLGDGQIPATNGAMLAAMLAPFGCEVLRLGPVGDDREALAHILGRADDADILVTSGGASVGDHDLIKPALEESGADLAFWKVAMKPGKPLLVATRGKQVVLGLPGNPVSSFVTGYLFLLPLVRAAMGASVPLPRTMKLPLAVDLGAGGVRREFLRGTWAGETVSPLNSQDSSALLALSAANCLIERKAGASPAPAGSLVTVYPLQNGGTA